LKLVNNLSFELLDLVENLVQSVVFHA
jgi:hypothetical protein